MAETETPPMLNHKVFWPSVVLAALCVIVMIWLIAGKVPLADVGLWPRLVVTILLVVFIAASLATNAVIPWSSRKWSDWRQPKILGTFASLLLAAVAFTIGMANLFAPPKADQATLLETKQTATDIKADTGKLVEGQEAIAETLGAGRPSLIRQKISGVWGEEGCAVTYRFSLEDRALKVTSLKSKAGMVPYNPEYSTTADSDRISATGERLSTLEANETRGYWPGYGVQFQYVTNGSTERLIWDHRKMHTNPLELVRCDG